MKSSTHLSEGLIPVAQKMSRRASLNIPKSPPDDFFPKLVHTGDKGQFTGPANCE